MVGRPRRRRVLDKHAPLLHPNSVAPVERGSVIDERVEKRKQRKPWLRPLLISLVGVVAIFALWAIIGTIVTYSKVTDKNSTKKAPILSFLGDIRPGQLQGEGDGRINVLLIGIGGPKHPGGTLADTIMVASFDPKNKEVALLSIPRDLYVPISGNGSGKINSAHSYGEQHNKKQGGGPAVLKKTVRTILDLPIHYYVRTDFAALEKTVDTLGGITVDVEKPIVDLSFPANNMIDFTPFRLNAGRQVLDGKTALKYVRSRHAASGEGSDFARARRQQKALSAIREKALTIGVLSNPKKITEIIAILGDHVKTDITVWEIERFMQLWKDIDSSKIVTKVLDNGPSGPLISESENGKGYYLIPRAGDFSEIQQIAHEIFADPYLREEKASISLINATGVPLIGQKVATMLRSYGYLVTDNTPKQQKKEIATKLVDHTRAKPYTKKFLESRFKTNASSLATENDNPYDLTLIVGANYQPPQVKNAKTPVKSSPSPTASPGSTFRDGFSLN